MSFLTTKTARSMMYLFGIGGLLVCNGLLVSVIWNELLYEMMGNNHQLTFLEGTGITAFAYVVVFAVKYGSATGSLAPYRTSREPAHGERESGVAKKCAGMTPEQRAALRQELIQTCGCRETEAK